MASAASPAPETSAALETSAAPETSTASGPIARVKTKRFWNWKLIALEIVITAGGVYGFLTRAPRFPGMVGFLIGLLGLWLLSREARGLAINAGMISLPSGRFLQLPILARGRRKISTDSVRELTVTQSWYTFQLVQIQGVFGSEVLIFQSRGQRLRFMNVMEKIRPDVQMYRRMPPGAQS